MNSLYFPTILLCFLLSIESGSFALAKENELKATLKQKAKRYSLKVELDTVEKRGDTRMDEFNSICPFPKALENSELNCVKYPTKIECHQYCVFGYTFPEGVQRHMKCYSESGQWTPHRSIEDCKPFIDCTVRLREGGKMNCKSHFIDKGTVCEICCNRFEDQEEVPMTEYRCNTEGQWDPPLPHCASPGTGLKLVAAPQNNKTITRKEIFDD